MFADTLSHLNFSGPICLGDTLAFECTVTGGVATVWEGSIFECNASNNEIVLLHSRFNSIIGATRSCNDHGDIVAQGVHIENNQYTSQLNVTLNSNMIGKPLNVFVIMVHHQMLLDVIL